MTAKTVLTSAELYAKIKKCFNLKELPIINFNMNLSDSGLGVVQRSFYAKIDNKLVLGEKTLNDVKKKFALPCDCNEIVIDINSLVIMINGNITDCKKYEDYCDQFNWLMETFNIRAEDSICVTDCKISIARKSFTTVTQTFHIKSEK